MRYDLTDPEDIKTSTEEETRVNKLEKRLHNAELAIQALLIMLDAPKAQALSNFQEQYFEASKDLGAFSSVELETLEN